MQFQIMKPIGDESFFYFVQIMFLLKSSEIKIIKKKLYSFLQCLRSIVGILTELMLLRKPFNQNLSKSQQSTLLTTQLSKTLKNAFL